MDNVFMKYMMRQRDLSLRKKKKGPVITLSREYGCYASEIAKKLTDKINNSLAEVNLQTEWRWISKEVLDEASHNLEVSPAEISHIFGGEEKPFLADLIVSFSKKKYTSDSRIRQTITKVVKAYAEQGNVIIVGRAGCVIADHIKDSLHVRMVAPKDWRVQRIRERFNISLSDAEKQVADIDDKRLNFMKFFYGDKPDSELFDAIYNRATLTTNQIVEAIFQLAKMRKVI